MALNYVTLTLDLYDGTGNLISAGTATFTPTVQLTDTTDHELIPPAPVTVSFKPTGSPVVKLLATDNAAPLPAGWAWTVSFSGVPGNPAGFSFDLPYSGGSAQYLSSVTQVASPVTTFPLNPMTASGDMIYGGASPAGTPERLGIGSAGQVLSVAGGVPAWATPSAVTVSPSGIANSQATIANNGAMFGPDTAGTTTQGLQEAITYAIAQIANITGTIAPPSVKLMAGDFDISSTLTIPVPSGVSTNGVAFEIEGSGHLATRVKFSAGEGFLFGQYGWQDVVFRNMCIENVNGGTCTSLITMVGSGSSLPDLRSEMMFDNVWFELSASPAGLPSNGCIYFGPYNGHTGGWDLYLTNCVMAGSFSITSPYNASLVNCLVASGSGVTFTTTTPLTHMANCEITGQIVLSGTNLTLRVDSAYWNQIPASTGAVSCTATSGTTRVIIDKSSLNLLGTGPLVYQTAGVVEMHLRAASTYVAGPGTYTLVGGGCTISQTSGYSGLYANGFYSGPGASVQGLSLTANPPVSGTTYQNTYGIAENIAVPVTYSPTSGAAATCALYIGPTSSPSLISTETYPANSTTGIIATLRFRIPSGWYYKIVAANATIGTATVLPEQ